MERIIDRSPDGDIGLKKITVIAVVLILFFTGIGFTVYNSTDYDGDGLSNSEERNYGTDPYNSDTSGDGISDDTAVAYHLDPTEKHHPAFVRTFQRIEPEDERTAKLLSLTLYRDDTLSDVEIDFLNSLNNIGSQWTFENVCFASTRDYTLQDWDIDFTVNFSSLVSSYPHILENFTEWLLSDEEISREDAEKVTYLKEDMDGVASALLPGKVPTESELHYIDILALSQSRLKDQVLEHSYHEDGNITGWELYYSRDNDGDGLINIKELSLGTSTNRTDTDRDGISDPREVFEFRTDPTISDSDYDGLDDGKEVTLHKTDPMDPDTDQDGISDGREVNFYYSDPKSKDPFLKDIETSLENNGKLDTFDIKYIKLLNENPRNIKEQIMSYEFHKDGEITIEEYEGCTDKDSDGLIQRKELEKNTNPFDPDTDKDGLLDGWEVYGVKRIRDNRSMKPVPLPKYGADPLHKDIFVEMIGELKLSEEQKELIEKVFAESPISNPDGTQGINIHIDDDTENYSLGGKNIEPVEDPEEGIGRRIGKEHYRFGTFYFGKIKGNMTNAGLGEIAGSNFAMNIEDHGDNDFFTSLFVHELGHNILGHLDGDNADDSGEGIHSRYEDYCMYSWPGNYTYHPDVWAELDRDGLLGLPTSPLSMRSSTDDWVISYEE